MEKQFNSKLEELAKRVASRFHDVSIEGVNFDLDHLSFCVYARINTQHRAFGIELARVEDAFEGGDEASLERCLAAAFRQHGARPRNEM